MSQAHADLKRVQSGYVSNIDGEVADSILISDDRALRATAIERAVLAVSMVWGAIRIDAVASAFSDFGWAWLYAVGCVWAVWHHISSIRFKSVRADFLPDRIRFSRGGSVETTIFYSEIQSVRVRKGVAGKWLEIVRKDGSNHSWTLKQVFARRETSEYRFVQALGPRLAPEVDFSRGVRPPSALEGLDYDHFYNIPPVEMKPGVSYRYRNASDIRFILWQGKDRHWAVALIPLFYISLTGGPSEFLVPILVLMLLAFLPSLVAKTQFSASLGDRFRMVPEGLEVTRKGQKWIVPLNEVKGIKARKIKLLHGTVSRYGPPLSAYYFDPRLIEPDV